MENNHGNLDEVVIDRLQLLSVLKKNKEKHDQIFTEAVDGFYDALSLEIEEKKIDVLNELEKVKIKAEERGYNSNPYIHCSNSFKAKFPPNHAQDYEVVIRKVELSVHEDIRLKSSEFHKFIMNNWDWREEFLTTNSMYASGCNVSIGSFLNTGIF